MITATAPRRFTAFISYSHTDARWALWLHRALERYRIPKALLGRSTALGPLHRSLAPVFIDRAEFSVSADLTASVREALGQSVWLIVICSPAAARSVWVNEEIRLFKSAAGTHRVLTLITDGDPNGAATGCFPESLRFQVSPDGTLLTESAPVPLGADVRPSCDSKRDALLKLIAALLDVPFDELRQRERSRQRRQRLAFASAAAIILAALGVAAGFTYLSRREAAAQQRVAQLEAQKSEQTLGYLKSMLRLADPNEQIGSSRMNRQTLDAAASMIRTELNSQPEVRASIGTTLAEVYAGLGLLREGKRWSEDAQHLYREANDAPIGDRLIGTTVLGEILFLRGEYTESERWLRESVALSHTPEFVHSGKRSRALASYGEVLIQLEKSDDAEHALQEALQIDRARADPSPDVARDLGLLASNRFFSGDLEGAERGFETSLAMRRQVLPPTHVKIAEDLNALGSIAYLHRNFAVAESRFAEALPMYQRFYGDDHPDTATLLNNYARVLLERGQFQRAIELLQTSLHADEKEKSAEHEDFAFSYDSLGLANMALGRLPEAQAWFEKGLAIASARKHRMQGPILVNLADLHCREGQTEQGLQLIEQARPLIRQVYADQPWREAMLESVEGSCMTAAGNGQTARSLLTRGYSVLKTELGNDSLFTRNARDRLRRAGS